MDELFELKRLLLGNNIPEALRLLDETIEMGKEEKLNRIFRFGKVLLCHLIKQRIEGRTLRAWQYAIASAVTEIRRTNARRNGGGVYFTEAELRDTLKQAYDLALQAATLDVCEGRYDVEDLITMMEREDILDFAIATIVYESSTEDLLGN